MSYGKPRETGAFLFFRILGTEGGDDAEGFIKVLRFRILRQDEEGGGVRLGQLDPAADEGCLFIEVHGDHPKKYLLPLKT